MVAISQNTGKAGFCSESHILKFNYQHTFIHSFYGYFVNENVLIPTNFWTEQEGGEIDSPKNQHSIYCLARWFLWIGINIIMCTALLCPKFVFSISLQRQLSHPCIIQYVCMKYNNLLVMKLTFQWVATCLHFRNREELRGKKLRGRPTKMMKLKV